MDTHSEEKTQIPNFLSVVFMKPLTDMIQASSSSGRSLHVLLKIQITEQFGAFEEAGAGTVSPGPLGQGLAGDKAEPAVTEALGELALPADKGSILLGARGKQLLIHK